MSNNPENKLKWLIWLAFLSCAVVVGYALFRPLPPEQVFEHSDKVGHIIAFLCLALTARLALKGANGWWLWSVLFSVAPLAEYLQGVILPLRYASWEDAVANLAGVCVAWLVYSFFKRN